MSNNYTGRQIAIFADVHGLYYPLKSVLEDIKNRGIKEIYSLGDNIGVGPNPKEVLELLDKYKVVSLLGNNEEYSILGIEPFSIYFDEKKTENQLWTHNKLAKEDIGKISKNKHSLDLLVGGKKIGLCHFASDVRFDFVKHNIWGYFDAIKNKIKNPQKQFYYTNSVYQKRLVDKKSKSDLPKDRGYVSAKKDPLFGGKKIDYYDEIIEGHAHFKLMTEDKRVKVRTIRALAMAYENNLVDRAYYIIIKEKKHGYDIDEILVPFDRKAMNKSIDESDMPDKKIINKYTSR